MTGRWVVVVAIVALGRAAAADPEAACPPGTRPVWTHPSPRNLATWCARPDRQSLGIWGLEQMCAQPPVNRSIGSTQWCERGDRARHGPFINFYPSGNVQQVGQYRDGKMDGLWVRWMDATPRRKASEEGYRDGQPHGPLRTWHEPGGGRALEGAFNQGRRDGHWTRWLADGSKSEEGDYVADQPNGPWATYHPGGKLKDKGVYDHGARVGAWISFHPDGSKASEGQYTRTPTGTLKVGPWRTYFPGGARKSEGAYAGSAPEGAWTLWWENGKTAATGAYAGGKRVEPWSWWHPDGKKATPADCRYETPSPEEIGACVASFVADDAARAPTVAPPPDFQPAKPLTSDMQCRCRQPPTGRLTWTRAEPLGLGQRVEIARAGGPGFGAPGRLSAELSRYASAADLRDGAEPQFQWRVLTRVAGGWVPGPAQTANAGCYPCDVIGDSPRPGPQPGLPSRRP